MSNNDEVVSKTSFAFPSNRPTRPTGRPAPTLSISMDDDPAEEVVERTPLSPRSADSTAEEAPKKVLPKSEADRSPDHISVELPSGWIFYPFKSLSLGNIRGRHQAKLSAASKNESTRMVVETISSLIGEEVSAADLTIPDFQFVLYQLYFNCMGSNRTLKVKGVCSNPDHVLDVAEGRKDRSTLTSADIVNRTQIKETSLNLKDVQEFKDSRAELVAELADLGWKLDAPRMSDSIDLEEQFLGKPEYDSVEFLTDLAGSISLLSGEATTFQQRLDAVSDFPPSLVQLLQEWQSVVQGYGVQEFIKIQCKECGSDIEVAASIPTHAFF